MSRTNGVVTEKPKGLEIYPSLTTKVIPKQSLFVSTLAKMVRAADECV